MFDQVKAWVHQALTIGQTISRTVPRRLREGPRQPRWTWIYELVVEYLKIQLAEAMEIERKRDHAEARQYLNNTGIPLSSSEDVDIEQVNGPVQIQYIEPEQRRKHVSVLYFHGGGYGVYPDSYNYILPLLARRIGLRLWVPDYRLAPEDPFPAALDDARACYFWLIDKRDVNPDRVVVMGDSAGGNLMLSLLLILRNNEEPMPSMGVGISPWTDLLNRGSSFQNNEPFDYINKGQADRLAGKYAGDRPRSNPLISPVEAELDGLCPLYFQAGEAEVLYDMIERFVDKARDSGLDVKFDTWEAMVHVFTLFHGLQLEVSEAQNRIREVINQFVGTRG